MNRPTLRQRFRYWFDNVMARGTGSLIGLLAVVTAALIALIAIVVLVFKVLPDGSESDPTTPEVLWNNLMHALDAGTVAGDVGWVYRALMLIVTVGGLFVVASLISIISGAFDAKVEQLRKGRSTVIETGHTVILGWNSKVAPIVRELCIANESERRPAIVILAQMDKVEMEDAIRDAVPSPGRTRIICRAGDPLDRDDLLRANPFAAKSIVVLGDEDSHDPDARAIKTTLALTHHPSRPEGKLHIVGQIRNEENAEVAHLVGGDDARWILAAEKIGQITAQASRQPGLSVVYEELLGFGGDEMYFTEQPTLWGRTYFDVQLAFVDSTVMGFATGRDVYLNPPADTVYREGDRILVIAEDDSTIRVAPPGVPDVKAAKAATRATESPEKTLVLGWNTRVPQILGELDEYVRKGSKVTLVSEVTPGELGRFKNTAITVREASTTSRAILESLDPAGFDHIIVVAYRDDMEVQDADSATLVTLLHLREILRAKGATRNVVSEMLDDRNRKLAEITQTDDFIVSDNIISLMMSQLSESPLLADVFDALFGSEGAEIYLRPAAWYVAPETEVDFYTVLAGARARGETALGYRVAHDDGPADVIVNPLKTDRRVFGPRDSIIVLAKD